MSSMGTCWTHSQRMILPTPEHHEVFMIWPAHTSAAFPTRAKKSWQSAEAWAVHRWFYSALMQLRLPLKRSLWNNSKSFTWQFTALRAPKFRSERRLSWAENLGHPTTDYYKYGRLHIYA